MNTNLVPTIKIQPNFAVAYNRYIGIRHKSKKQVQNEEKLKVNKPKAQLSQKAVSRLRNSIAWIVQLAKVKRIYSNDMKRYITFKINFITLTLSAPQIHCDNHIKSQLLNQFLTEARDKWKLKNYVWRAETQKNGNIHFHIISDVFIPYKELRDTWNRIQNKLGYIDRFKEKNGHSSPNSTDVHSVLKLRNLAAYLTKYCTKEQTRFICGKTWAVSNSLSNVRGLIIDICSSISGHIGAITSDIKMIFSDWNVVYCSKIDYWLQNEVIRKRYEEYVTELDL